MYAMEQRAGIAATDDRLARRRRGRPLRVMLRAHTRRLRPGALNDHRIAAAACEVIAGMLLARAAG